MAAGQQKKRFHASSVVSCDLQERFGTRKKRNVVAPPNFLNIKAHITLEWDEQRQKVVAKRDQIGLTWRNLGPFINPLPPHHSALADVISIPQEVFGLEDLTGVLSYEVWETQLSETEKSFLTQLLPRGADAGKVVQSLLGGENLHFGNPFHKWSVSLCSGKLHPDAILCQERSFSVYEKAYSSELEEYCSEYFNDNVVENLQRLKETWTDCGGPERDIVEKMWRQGYAEKSGNISTASQRPKLVASSRKEDKPPRLYVRSSCGAKYMSYFKITKKQHELVKGIKQPNGIKSKCLNHILGDIGSLQVQSYEVYEEEEHKKLHAHWLQVSNKDIPFASIQRAERILRRTHWRRSLEQELREDISLDMQDKEGTPVRLLPEDRVMREAEEAVVITSPHSSNNRDFLQTPSHHGDYETKAMTTEAETGNQEMFTPEDVSPVLSEFEGEQNSQECLQRIPSLNGYNDSGLINTGSGEGRQEIFIPKDGMPVLSAFMRDPKPREASEQKDLHSFKRSVLHSTVGQSLERIPSPNGDVELDPLDIDLGESSEEISKPDGAVQMFSQFVENIDPTGTIVEQQVCLPSGKDEWLEMGLPDSYHNHAAVNHVYTSTSDLSVGQQHFAREGPRHLIALETDIIKQDATENLLHEPSDNMTAGFHIDTGGSFSSSYPNQDHNELFHPFFERQGLLPTQANKQYLGTRDLLLEAGRLQEQQRQMRERDYYMQQVVHKNMYGRFTPTSVNMQNWVGNPGTETSAFQARLSENPCSSVGAHRSHVGWSDMDVSSSSQYLGNGMNADGSLYSVLSQFNRTQPVAHNNLVDACEARKVGGFSSSNGAVFPQAAAAGHQLNYMSGHEAGSTMKASHTPWGDLPQQSSSLHDSLEKPFLRSWNQVD